MDLRGEGFTFGCTDVRTPGSSPNSSAVISTAGVRVIRPSRIRDRSSSAGFGRINGAGWRWAGERDVFEPIAAVKKRFNIDDKRIILRGFSRVGEGAWHISLHHPDRFAAAEIGAGTVSRTAEILNGPGQNARETSRVQKRKRNRSGRGAELLFTPLAPRPAGGHRETGEDRARCKGSAADPRCCVRTTLAIPKRSPRRWRRPAAHNQIPPESDGVGPAFRKAFRTPRTPNSATSISRSRLPRH